MAEVTLLCKNTELCLCLIENRKRRILVAKNKDYLIAVSPVLRVATVPFVPLAKVSEEGIDDFYRLVGKLSMKDYSSKYLLNPKFGEHLINGNIKESDIGGVVELAMTACYLYENPSSTKEATYE